MEMGGEVTKVLIVTGRDAKERMWVLRRKKKKNIKREKKNNVI